MKTWRNASLDYLALVTPESLNQRDWDTWDRAAIVQDPTSTSTFSGHVIVLADRFCASACELAVKTLRAIDGTTITGEYTAGVAAIGNNGLRRLPGSNLEIQWGNWFERDLSVDSDRFREGRGFAPDIWVAPGSVETDDGIRKLAAAGAARSTIAKYLRASSIPLRTEDEANSLRKGQVGYGKKVVHGQEVAHQREVEVIRRISELRAPRFELSSDR